MLFVSKNSLVLIQLPLAWELHFLMLVHLYIHNVLHPWRQEQHSLFINIYSYTLNVILQTVPVNCYWIPTMERCTRLVVTLVIEPSTHVTKVTRSWVQRKEFAKLLGCGRIRSLIAKRQVIHYCEPVVKFISYSFSCQWKAN